MGLISLRQLLECGVHFGHPTRKWNPKMKQYIYTKRNGIHILDLQQTTKQIDVVHDYILNLISKDHCILFVGTKKQAQEAVAEEAKKCGMYFVNKRWLGGMLTNWRTIKSRIDRLNELSKQQEEGYFEELSKKDKKALTDEMEKLDKFLGGIAHMPGLPHALFIIDVKKEYNAVREARKLNLPIIGILDSNCDPDDVDIKLVGNDDAIRSIRLFCSIISDSVLKAKNGILPPDSVFIKAQVHQESGDETMAALESKLGKPMNKPVEREIVPEIKLEKVAPVEAGAEA